MYTVDELESNLVAAKQVQTKLTGFGLLDPPPDGKWGKYSDLALSQAGKLLGLPVDDNLVREVLTRDSLVTWELTSDIASLVVGYMLRKNLYISRLPGSLNIVYVEGCDISGKPNDDRNDYFNDLRLLVDATGKTPVIRFWQSATIEPGRWYIDHPMNPSGAAFIKHGQYKAWRVGYHGKSDRHQALVQVNPVTVYRDANKNAKRDKLDKQETGLFGINQHWGYDMPRVGKASAGCAVGQSRTEHRRFMELVKGDIRYTINNRYTFISTFIPGDQLGGN